MKLLTLNAHSWQERDQLDKIDYLAKVIADHQYDVIALQEVSQRIDSTPLANSQLREDNYAYLLVEKLNRLSKEQYKLSWTFAHIGYDIYQEGLAIITKHPIIEEKAIPLTVTANESSWKRRVALKLTIDFNNQDIDIFSCHLGFWHDQEEPAKEQFVRLIEATQQDRLTFLMGDFNTDASVSNEGYDFLSNQGWFDTYKLAETKDKGYTIPGQIDGWRDADHSAKRIDYIFVNQPLEINHFATIFTGDHKKIISDHFGVEVEGKL